VLQEDNGMPIHLKGGTKDALLYRTTMVLTVLGTGYVFYELVKASFPRQK
ncbi:Cytochrome c oxidase subunit 7A2, partial [Nibea albiflora]